MSPQARQLFAVALLSGGMFALTSTPKPPEQVAVMHKPAQAAPVATPQPPQRSTEHRKQHRPVPRLPKREFTPIPRIRPIAPIMREEKRARPKQEKRQRVASSRLPSCSVIRREYEGMSHMQRLAAYARATPEEVAHGRRCLGF